jgi:hypothetical protein
LCLIDLKTTKTIENIAAKPQWHWAQHIKKVLGSKTYSILSQYWHLILKIIKPQCLKAQTLNL